MVTRWRRFEECSEAAQSIEEAGGPPRSPAWGLQGGGNHSEPQSSLCQAVGRGAGFCLFYARWEVRHPPSPTEKTCSRHTPRAATAVSVPFSQ